jgi:hypothetical protein
VKGFASAWAHRTPWLGEESGKPVYAAVETSDLAAKLKRGLSYILNEKTTQRIHLKSNTLSDYTRTFEKDILPLLRKQNGFKDEITFAGPGGVDVTAISLWDNKADAEAYNTNTYPQVLKTMARFIEGTPKVQTSDVVNSTFHKSTELVTA